jgi:hypothetical protein
MVGSAVLTIVWSSAARSMPSATVPKTAFVRTEPSATPASPGSTATALVIL